MLANCLKLAASCRSANLNRGFGFLKNSGEPKKEAENQQDEKDRNKRRKQTQNKQPDHSQQDHRKKATRDDIEVDTQSLVRESAKSMFNDLSSSALRPEAINTLDTKTSKQTIKAKSSFSALRAVTKMLNNKRRENENLANEVDLDKMSLQEVILSPMERFKVKVEEE